MVSAILVLADGSVFKGKSIGVDGFAVGEVVFNTALTAYQEAITDPTYVNKLIAFTYPHIGNVGINAEDNESDKIQAQGIIIRDLSLIPSSFRSEQSLDAFLKQHNTVAIADVDTRRLTQIIRDKGIQAAVIYAGKDAENKVDEALAKAKEFSSTTGQDLVADVSTKESYSWTEGVWRLGKGFTQVENPSHHVVVYDLGVKRNVLRTLASLGCRLTVVPAQTSAEEVLSLQPDGVFLSNGPGDAKALPYVVDAVKQLLEQDIPLFGLCLGHQVLALAAGANTQRLVAGHYGNNHPVKNLADDSVMITAQAHDFVVAEDSINESIEVTHKALFDGTIQGIKIKGKKAFSIQAYPELSSIPNEVAPLYSDFIALMQA